MRGFLLVGGDDIIAGKFIQRQHRWHGIYLQMLRYGSAVTCGVGGRHGEGIIPLSQRLQVCGRQYQAPLAIPASDCGVGFTIQGNDNGLARIAGAAQGL
ncbi:hypothetical protein D3C80_1031550 [compost metagenome]